MARFCSNCGTTMDDTATFCSKCGAAAGGAPPAGYAATPAAGSGLADNVAGMLAYFTIIPAIIFLVVAPFNQNRFVRFHAFQCLFFWVALVVIHIVLMFIPFVGWALNGLVSLAALALWIVLIIKAYQGQKWKLPVIGDLAEKNA